ncbi:MAG: hypothetical protein QM753_02000 [Thermomicrobiales bacterium]
MPNQTSDTDGRSLWWMIPSAIAGVLGIAGATIVRQRRRQEDPGTVAHEEASPAPPPLADLPEAPAVNAPKR